MRANYKYKHIWGFTQVEAQFIRDRFVGKTYNFFSGRVKLGDIRVDADPENKPDVILDIMDKDKLLEFFRIHGPSDTTLLDPPFTIWFKTDRMRMIAWMNIVTANTRKRVIKVGGWKMTELKDFHIVYPIFCYTGPSGELKPIFIYERNSGSLTNEPQDFILTKKGKESYQNTKDRNCSL